MPYVSTKDIARVAFHALTSPTPLGESIKTFGPELLTMDEVAATLSEVLGRKIEHVRLSPEERTKYYIGLGMPEFVAGFMTQLEVGTAKGLEAMEDDSVEKVTGEKALAFKDWVEENKAVWGGA